MSKNTIEIQTAIITAGASVLIALAVWILGRSRDRRNLTLELHRQYYLPEMGKARLNAAKFITANCHVDWNTIDPYKLLGEESWKDGYSEVVRYFHKVGALARENETNLPLMRRLLAREYGFWYSFLFQPMAGRVDWWTKETILGLVNVFDKAGGKSDYSNGVENGRERRAKARAHLIVTAKTL